MDSHQGEGATHSSVPSPALPYARPRTHKAATGNDAAPGNQSKRRETDPEGRSLAGRMDVKER